MSRAIVLSVVAALAASSAFAQQVYRSVGPDGRVTYSDQAPGTIPYTVVPTAPNAPLPTSLTPVAPSPGTVPDSAVPRPDPRDSVTGRVVPGTVGPDSSDRRFGVPDDAQRIDREAARANIEQGERERMIRDRQTGLPQGEQARDAEAMRIGRDPNQTARDARDRQVGVPADEAQRERDAVKLNQ